MLYNQKKKKQKKLARKNTELKILFRLKKQKKFQKNGLPQKSFLKN